MVKADAAVHLLGVARSIYSASAGDEEAEVWIMLLLWIAEGLDPKITRRRAYGEIVSGSVDSRRAKLRRLIEHPGTPTAEREAAVAALHRITTAAA